MPFERRFGALCALLVAGLAAVLTAQAPPPPSPGGARADLLKRDLVAQIDGMKDFTQQMVDQVFSFGELGFQEVETSKYLTGILKSNGFRVTDAVAGIPTAWTASWGSGKPVIALGSDVDCIPQASQKPGVAYHAPIIEGAPGHGEGHNSGMPLNITAALALKKIMERDRIGGTILLWPGIAEELLATKAYFVRAGVFKDADVVLFAHVGSNFAVNWGDSGTNGLVSVEYTFKGESAHAGQRPLARAVGARRRRTDGRWLELPPRAPAHSAAIAFSHHQRGRPAERRPLERSRLVLLPRIRLRAYQGNVGHRESDVPGGRDDDRHRGQQSRARGGVAAPHEQGGRRGHVREHQVRRPAALERGR